ncbi:MAG: TIGR00266 family protein [Gammaproteobacteria bacterium]|nr:TIGR00266 family protein [Gammaproteobacteria bacterium]
MAEKIWYVEVNGNPKGPYSSAEIKKGLKSGKITEQTLIYGPNMSKWEPISWVPDFTNFDHKKRPPTIPKPTFHRGKLAHEIDFRIRGNEMQYVEVELDPGEAAVAEAGSMMYMDNSIDMETIFGDGTENRGIFDKLVGAGKRLLTGENLFMTVFTNNGDGKQCVAFAAPYPGKIIPMNLAEMGGEITCQKDAFLCAAKGVSIDIVFQKKIGVGLFGGEGFVMQKLKGDGLAFVHAGGTILSRELQAGEILKVDSGCLVAVEPSVHYDIQYVGSVKSALFGGEGFFYAQLTGPGTIWLQSMPFSRLAGRIHEAAPQTGSKKVGEGSVFR